MATEGKLLHILGGGQWQLPTVKLAKSMGLRVLVTDMYQERPAYAFADHHEVIDITDKEATLAVARRHKIDGIICDTTDVGVPTMAWIAEQLGLPGIGYETALNFTNKYRMRERTRAAGLPNPPFMLLRSASAIGAAVSEIGLPIVFKPVDSQSGRGVHVVRERAELEEKFADALQASRSRQVIAEGFMPGTEITVESVCIEGEVYAVGISDKDHFAHRPEVANRLTYPAAFSPGVMQRIRERNASVVRALGLRTGITHAEYMVHGEEVTLVEIAARGAGSRVYSTIVPYLAGVLVPKLYLEHVLGTPMRAPGDGVPRAANLAFFDFKPGRVKEISGVEEASGLPGVAEILLEFGVGDVLIPPNDDRSRPGLVVVLGRTREEVLAMTAEAVQRVRVDVDPG